MWGELATSFQNGNVYLLIMLGFMFIALTIIVERVIMLNFVYNINFTKFLGNLKKMIASSDLDRAINLCRSVSKTALPRIALKALEASETDPTTVKSVLDEESIEFLPRLESRLAVLPAVATLIMLIGILGTIDGLWGSFHSIDVLDTAKKQASLAGGIAGTLNSTAMGLVCCMIILAAHQILRGTALRLTERLHYGVTILFNILVPKEVATTYVAAAPMSGAAINTGIPEESNEGESFNDLPESEGDAVDDAFDDASVEDIKDEEEII